MAKYCRRKTVIDAVQWFEGDEHPSVIIDDETGRTYCRSNDGGPWQVLNEINSGSWIVRYADDSTYPYSPKLFKRLFEPVKEEVNEEADEQKYIDWYHKEDVDGIEF